MDELKIISVNVIGLNTYEKRVKIYDWLNDSKIDIAILQETHYVERNITKYDARWFGKSIHSFADENKIHKAIHGAMHQILQRVEYILYLLANILYMI